MAKARLLADMARSELSDLVKKLASEMTVLGQAYAHDPTYRRYIAKAEARRKAIAAKNSVTYYKLAMRHQQAERALERKRDEETNANVTNKRNIS